MKEALSWNIPVLAHKIDSYLDKYDKKVTWLSKQEILGSTVIVGMFAFSSLIGILADIIGRKYVSIIGMLTLAIGCFITPLTANFYIITLGLFLIGLGWSSANIASTSMIADINPANIRGRVTGVNDMLSGAFSVLFTLIGPIIANYSSLAIICYIATIISLSPIILLLTLKEPNPGQFILKK